MQEHMKKHPTEYREIRYRIPFDQCDRACKYLMRLGAVDIDDEEESIPWRECELFRESIEKYGEFGPVLCGMRYREELTQVQLAQKTGIPQRHISEMERGKRTIGKKNAKILAKALNCSYKVFL